MPIIVMNIVTPLGESDGAKISAAIKRISAFSSEVLSASIYKTSLDARKHSDIKFVSSVIIKLKSAKSELEAAKRYPWVKYFEEPGLNPEISPNKRDGRVVVTGFGPAGMFCALLLSEYGYNPIVLERGDCVEKRVRAVERFWTSSQLDEDTNVQFGEGGAGTFSDGKLTTRISDPLTRYVLKRLCEFGAPPEILETAKPHVGTDKLRKIVSGIRHRIIENGGEVRFLTKLTGISLKNGSVQSAITSQGGDIKTSALVLALGHSARDTFQMLLDSGISLSAKPFSVGARIEHTQQAVDRSLYGELAESGLLPIGEYQLSHRRPDGRAVYTFCMCPGGTVVAAASERESVVTNGMSEYARNGENANSALVVSVTPEDFGKKPLDGVEFARHIEKTAFRLSGGYLAPASTVGGFMGGHSKPGVIPSYKPGVVPCDLNLLFPGFVCEMMKEGLSRFSSEMSCFGDGGAILTAPETRTSSPVRITRQENMCALGVDNLYPCGEGAGYAGGIMSAAVDGIKTALAIMKSIAP